MTTDRFTDRANDTRYACAFSIRKNYYFSFSFFVDRFGRASMVWPRRQTHSVYENCEKFVEKSLVCMFVVVVWRSSCPLNILEFICGLVDVSCAWVYACLCVARPRTDSLHCIERNGRAANEKRQVEVEKNNINKSLCTHYCVSTQPPLAHVRIYISV